MNVVLEENWILYFHPYESFPTAFLPTVLSLARCALSNEQCSISKLQQFSQQLQPRRWVCNKYLLYPSCWYGSLCVSMHFIPWKIMLRTPPFLARRKYFPKAFKTFHPGIPCNAEYCLYMYCLCGGWKLSIRGPPGQLLVRTHRACTSNPQHLLTSVLEAFSTSSELAFLPHFLSWGSLGCWIPRWMTRKEILFEAKQPRFWDAILERRTNEGMFN